MNRKLPIEWSLRLPVGDNLKRNEQSTAANVANIGMISEAASQLRQKAITATLKRLVPGVRGPQLTKRELLVLELAAEGKTSAEIASTLFISRRTAEAHRANLMKKLGLKTQTDLVLYAVRNGMISP